MRKIRYSLMLELILGITLYFLQMSCTPEKYIVLNLLLKHAFEEMGAKAVHNVFEDERDIALKVHLDCGFREVRRENGIIHLMITAEDFEKISE